jgi:glycosyltransferase involved in cell wall biosynthesis
MPIFNEERHLLEALESLTAQTEDRLGIVVIDNASTDRSHEIASAVAGSDARVTVERTARHLGMIDSWTFAFLAARRIHPEVSYFAWVGGHDRWHPRWLETLVGELDALPEAVGVFPQGVEIDSAGRVLGPVLSRGDTAGIVRARDRAAVRLPGVAIHALFRSEVLERTLPRRVLLPDLLLLAELAALGSLKEVPETLWYRRQTAPPSALARERQRGTVFGRLSPVHARLPWPVVHAAALVWDFGVRGNGSLPRGEGVRVALAHLRLFSHAIAPGWRRRYAAIRWTLRKRRWALKRWLAKIRWTFRKRRWALKRWLAKIRRRRRQQVRKLRTLAGAVRRRVRIARGRVGKARRRLAKRARRAGRALFSLTSR